MTQQVTDMLGTRLREIMYEHGCNIQQLAEMTDLPLETIRNIYYDKVKDPKVSTVMAISKVFHIPVNYLMGESINTKQEDALIRNFRKCSRHGKSAIMMVAKYEADISVAERGNHFDLRRIPCLLPTGNVMNGIKYSETELVDAFTDNTEAYLAIDMISNNLAPAFCKGDKVLIADRFPEHGEKAFFYKDGVILCRKYVEANGKYILQSLTGRSPSFEFKRMDEIECVGTCIGVIRA